jgi:hypothetical protein
MNRGGFSIFLPTPRRRGIPLQKQVATTSVLSRRGLFSEFPCKRPAKAAIPQSGTGVALLASVAAVYDRQFCIFNPFGAHPRHAGTGRAPLQSRAARARYLKFRYRREYNDVRSDRLKALLGSRRWNGTSFPLAFSRVLKNGQPMVGGSVAAVLHRHFSTGSKSRWRREVAATSVFQHSVRP